MALATPTLFAFDNSFVRELEGLYEPWTPAPVPEPRLLTLNRELATELGVDPEDLASTEGVAVLAGNTVPDGAEPVAQAYSGHQFGGFSPRLGDGRAVLLGEVVDREGNRRDLHMKGSGRTPFARGGDGKAAVGPMLREHLIGEAMWGLGIPTTRALSVVATGEEVRRESLLPGAVLTRVASSHLRVGTFQYAALQQDRDLLTRLSDHAIARHHPEATEAENRHVALFRAVVEVQADLVARWMAVGFIHGVMNTDNTTISGETIDYGPCAFMEAHDPSTVFSSIDHGGRYAYGNQPAIAQWNLARLAEALLPLFADDDDDAAVAVAREILDTFGDLFRHRWSDIVQAKLGLSTVRDGDATVVEDLFTQLTAERVDHTMAFRTLARTLRGEESVPSWAQRWRERIAVEDRDPEVVAAEMDAVNPVYIARNHLVEETLAAGEAGDLEPFEQFLDVLADPFTERRGLERYAESAPDDFGPYVTFCGT